MEANFQPALQWQEVKKKLSSNMVLHTTTATQT